VCCGVFYLLSLRQRLSILSHIGLAFLGSEVVSIKALAAKPKRLRLHGFNNLTKSLSFSMYDICFAQTVEDRNAYLAYIDEMYNAERLTAILTNVANIIGAHVLSIAKQDYEPIGASVTILVSEEQTRPPRDHDETPGPVPNEVLGHLDKSHIAVHTYPEYHPDDGISTFRVDIDVSTCGHISPLKALNYLMQSFETDVVTIDYKVRGFTRDLTGRKLFIDHKITSIQNYIPLEIKREFEMMDVNIYQENIFHTRCKYRDFDLDEYLFGISVEDIPEGIRRRIEERIKKERDEIYYGRNLS